MVLLFRFWILAHWVIIIIIIAVRVAIVVGYNANDDDNSGGCGGGGSCWNLKCIWMQLYSIIIIEYLPWFYHYYNIPAKEMNSPAVWMLMLLLKMMMMMNAALVPKFFFFVLFWLLGMFVSSTTFKQPSPIIHRLHYCQHTKGRRSEKKTNYNQVYTFWNNKNTPINHSRTINHQYVKNANGKWFPMIK